MRRYMLLTVEQSGGKGFLIRQDVSLGFVQTKEVFQTGVRGKEILFFALRQEHFFSFEKAPFLLGVRNGRIQAFLLGRGYFFFMNGWNYI